MQANGTGVEPITAVIVGAGFGGLGMAFRLRQAGVTDFLILERSDQIGGTWYDNSYPRAACDIPSPLYSFSFEQDFDWPRFYSGQADIHRYLRYCAEKHRLMQHVRLNSELRRAAFDEQRGLWLLELASGERHACRALITATGMLSRPAWPQIPGLGSFRGKAFHSARWDHAHDLTGKRVGVIGTGASAVQFIPEVVAKAAQVTIFQRTAPYVLPKPDRRLGRVEHWLCRKLPPLRTARRAAVYGILEPLGVGLFKLRPVLAPVKGLCWLHLRLSIDDPALRAKLKPDYAIGCKRVLFENAYYPALARPHVSLITRKIDAVGADHVLTDDGTKHELDTLILGTGFAATEFLASMEIRGRQGRELSAAWRDGAEAYLGISVSGFPNLFMLGGPNTNVSHNSLIYMLESQANYVRDAILRLRAAPQSYFDVEPEAQRAFNVRLQRALAGSVWAEGCRNWYTHGSGKITTNWPGFTFSYRRVTRRFDAEHYREVTVAPAARAFEAAGQQL